MYNEIKIKGERSKEKRVLHDRKWARSQGVDGRDRGYQDDPTNVHTRRTDTGGGAAACT